MELARFCASKPLLAIIQFRRIITLLRSKLVGLWLGLFLKISLFLFLSVLWEQLKNQEVPRLGELLLTAPIPGGRASIPTSSRTCTAARLSGPSSPPSTPLFRWSGVPSRGTQGTGSRGSRWTWMRTTGISIRTLEMGLINALYGETNSILILFGVLALGVLFKLHRDSRKHWLGYFGPRFLQLLVTEVSLWR